MKNLIQCVSLMRVFNFLRIEYISDQLSENVEFSSDWVLSTIVGREPVIEFLTKKLSTMQNCVHEGRCGYYARLFCIEDFPNEVLVELTYRIDDLNDSRLMQVDVNEETGLINAIRFMEWREGTEFYYEND